MIKLLSLLSSQPNTGLVRLLPRELYDSEVYKKNKKTLSMRVGAPIILSRDIPTSMASALTSNWNQTSSPLALLERITA